VGKRACMWLDRRAYTIKGDEQLKE
jgi:hypothetical protein